MQENSVSSSLSDDPKPHNSFQNLNNSTPNIVPSQNQFSNFSDTNTIIHTLTPNLAVLLITLFFIALPLIAYFAYKHGRNTAMPKAVRDAYYYFGPAAQKTRVVTPEASIENSYRSAGFRSRNSSTNSSPELSYTRSRNNSLTNQVAPGTIERRESSVQTQEEEFEDLDLDNIEGDQNSTTAQTCPVNKEKQTSQVICRETSTTHEEFEESEISLKNKGLQITVNLNEKKYQNPLIQPQNHSLLLEKCTKIQEEQNLELIIKKYGLPDETGKFKKIFQNIEWIGEGSFGQVQKVVHLLDGRVYAVKKVRLNLGKFENIKSESKVFREVFAMTDLHHCNIVRYYTCWIEIESEPKSINHSNKKIQKHDDDESQIICKKLSKISEDCLGGEEDDSDDESEDQSEEDISSNSNMGFEWDVASQSIKSLPKKTPKIPKADPSKKQKNNKDKFLLQSLSKSFVEDSKDLLKSFNSHQTDLQFHQNHNYKLYLYIQMEYCSGQSLKYYLESPQRVINKETSVCMFKKIVEGVRAIHLKGIIHRDLKPANIFLDGNGDVKIGDFGLALLNKTDESSSSNSGSPDQPLPALNRVHSLKVGTPMYTSPEQEAGGNYDERTDIYSLGLIFYEMLVSFSTGHERYIHFNMIKHEHRLPQSFVDHFEKESSLILSMTEKAPENRPSLDELLKKL